jgi:hypothetical protein
MCKQEKLYGILTDFAWMRNTTMRMVTQPGELAGSYTLARKQDRGHAGHELMIYNGPGDPDLLRSLVPEVECRTS